MSVILNEGFVTFFSEWDIADMPNWMSSVVPSLHIAGSIERSQLIEPFFMRRHVVGGVGVEKPYVFRTRGVGRTGG